MNPGKYVKCKGSKELEFVPEGKFPSCDPDDIEGWYKYDPESKKWDYVDNKGNNNPWVPNGDNNDKLPFDPTKGPKYWILNPETGKWEYVPEGSPMPFDTSKNPTWPQYEWNPETRQWDYSQGGKDNLPFNPSAGKLSGVYVFNPETQKWEWYDKLDNVPFDYKDPNTPWYVYNLK